MDSCSICLEKIFPKSDSRIIVTTCNHIFHVRCIYLANYNKSEIKCALCRAEMKVENIEKIKYLLNANELKIFPELFDIYNLMENPSDDFDWINNGELGLKSWFISGGYAVYLYNKLIEKKYFASYTDINIYSVNPNVFFKSNNKIAKINLKGGEIESSKYESKYIDYCVPLKIGKLRRTTNENFLKVENENFSSLLNNTNMISEMCHINNEIKLNICKLNNILKYEKNKNRIDSVISEFDLSCCKIGVIIKKSHGLLSLKFYIHKDFWCNIYNKNGVESDHRIVKYKLRGYDLMEFN
jgi:hypothetical protein